MVYFIATLKALLIGLAIGALFYFVRGSLFTAAKIGLGGAGLVFTYELRHKLF